VEDDVYFRTLMRYVEANPLKAKLVDRAQDWEWSSLGCASGLKAKLLDPWPVDRPRNWLALVNQPMSETDSRRVRDSMARCRPLGSDSWTKEMAERLGLQYTLRPRGRPKALATREAAVK
jgi:putative transposase